MNADRRLGVVDALRGFALLAIVLLFMLQLAFSRMWLKNHAQGPLERLWKRGTWLGARRAPAVSQ